jgi:hypothetical protein
LRTIAKSQWQAIGKLFLLAFFYFKAAVTLFNAGETTVKACGQAPRIVRTEAFR